MNKAGILYVVATPIGNLEDITLRALRILKEVDFILCEDTRVTVKLLNKYEIKTKLISFHKFNEKSKLEYVLSLLTSGKNLALVSDAGTPLISDPGLELISYLRNNNLSIVPIPGPSSLTSALSVCPFNSNEFLFLGYLPDNKSIRKKLLISLKMRANLVLLLIPPHDLKKHLKEIYNSYPNIDVFYAREITKIYEDFWCGKISNLLEVVEKKNLKGEIILGLYFENIETAQNKTEENQSEILDRMKALISKGTSLKESSKMIGKEYNVSSNKLYNLYLKMC